MIGFKGIYGVFLKLKNASLMLGFYMCSSTQLQKTLFFGTFGALPRETYHAPDSLPYHLEFITATMLAASTMKMRHTSCFSVTCSFV